jgi:hypothetical protein
MNLRSFLVLLLAALLAACSEPRWVRQDASAEQADRDDIDCQRQAAREASAAASGFYGPPGPYRRDSISRPDQPFDSYGYRTRYEGSLHNLCMRAKGYERKCSASLRADDPAFAGGRARRNAVARLPRGPGRLHRADRGVERIA